MFFQLNILFSFKTWEYCPSKFIIEVYNFLMFWKTCDWVLTDLMCILICKLFEWTEIRPEIFRQKLRNAIQHLNYLFY